MTPAFEFSFAFTIIMNRIVLKFMSAPIYMSNGKRGNRQAWEYLFRYSGR